MTKIIPFFRRYRLLSIKQESFELFSEIVTMMSREEHSTISGLREIISKAYAMNDNGRYRKVSMSELCDSLKSSETICRNSVKTE